MKPLLAHLTVDQRAIFTVMLVPHGSRHVQKSFDDMLSAKQSWSLWSIKIRVFLNTSQNGSTLLKLIFKCWISFKWVWLWAEISLPPLFPNPSYAPGKGVTNHWTGLLDWTTGLDYWTQNLPTKSRFLHSFNHQMLLSVLI